MEKNRQASIDLSHHLSRVAKARTPSPLKDLQKYFGKEGIISLAGGQSRSSYQVDLQCSRSPFCARPPKSGVFPVCINHRGCISVRHVFWDPRRSFSSCMDMESLFGDQGENDASLHPEVPKQTRGSESGDSFAVRSSFGDPPASRIREEIHGSNLQAGIYRLQDLFTHR